MTIATTRLLDRTALLDRFVRIRARTRALFNLLDEAVYYERPIALRNPVVFYEGHLPAFAVNTLVRKALRRPGIDEHLETIFARGIDPETEVTAAARGNPSWPSRARVKEFAAAADAAVIDAIEHADLDRDDDPLLAGAQALWTILEHEEMHQETLAYMWHELPYNQKRKPPAYRTLAPSLAAYQGEASLGARVRIPSGIATLGTSLADSPFAWDNEMPAHAVAVEEFVIDAHNVTNAAFMAFVEAGGYRDPRWWRPEDWSWVAAREVTHPHFWMQEDGRWFWRGMFDRVPLPDRWPVYVTWAEANAYAAWRGRRLPTEAEFHRAAFGTSDPAGEQRYPWGSALRGRAPGNFDFWRWDPQPVGSHPKGASAYGVHDLIGNGWEWTSTVFAPFPGFSPMASYPEYSADFFDGEHFVLKGASPVTARALVRRGLRNWFRPQYPYVYATFRCAGTA